MLRIIIIREAYRLTLTHDKASIPINGWNCALPPDSRGPLVKRLPKVLKADVAHPIYGTPTLRVETELVGGLNLIRDRLLRRILAKEERTNRFSFEPIRTAAFEELTCQVRLLNVDLKA
jgi:hypothetical protein